MKYARILLASAATPWAMQPEKLRAISDFLLFKARGGNFSAEELEARISKGREREVVRSSGEVAVLPIYGVLCQRANLMDEISGGTSMEGIAAHFRELLLDEKVKAIILDVDSPGGTVSGTEELAQEIYDSRGTKPIVAQVNSLAASAAFWIAAQADEIVITPGGEVGSVGVYSIHDDISKLLEMEGVKTTLITAKDSPYKTEGDETLPLSTEAQAFRQSRADQAMSHFVRDLARGRNVSPGHVKANFGGGRCFFAVDALERKMVDRVGTMRETLDRFGVDLNPVAKRNATASASRVAAAGVLSDKLRARQEPTRGELVDGLKVALGLSNSEAERAVYDLLHERSGKPENVTDQAAVREALRDFREKLNSIPTL